MIKQKNNKNITIFLLLIFPLINKFLFNKIKNNEYKALKVTIRSGRKGPVIRDMGRIIINKIKKFSI